jgi:hypothetical protein
LSGQPWHHPLALGVSGLAGDVLKIERADLKPLHRLGHEGPKHPTETSEVLDVVAVGGGSPANPAA